ncbi:hypothetical protein E2C01_076643 [Portunus trituberculatus]|uniref:Uncharacterized protein n=1 Tax=Portunus trituberculatus TaxID=210409 RepID=A0A5B7I979_PORTR|nr:hypothetical protein [Portunus trituberculatus]
MWQLLSYSRWKEPEQRSAITRLLSILDSPTYILVSYPGRNLPSRQRESLRRKNLLCQTYGLR